MKSFSKDEIVSGLKKNGLIFSEFTIPQDGNYHVEDVDWNLKDALHLHFVHDGIENVNSVVGDDLVSHYSVVDFLGMKIPCSTIIYDSAPNIHMLCTVMFCFALIVETKYEELEQLKTRVHTSYCLGAPRIFKPLFPMIRKRLKKHYENLMKDDIPMRERRGELRSWGYTFRGYSAAGAVPGFNYQQSRDIKINNVITPRRGESPSAMQVNLSDVLPTDGIYLMGRDDHLGLELVRENNEIRVYPRMCPHDGASLDAEKCIGRTARISPRPGRKGSIIICPWHGRAIPPLAKFDISSKEIQKLSAEFQDLTLTNGVLSVTPRA